MPLVFFLASGLGATDLVLRNAKAQVYFSPNGGCTDALVELVDRAKKEVFVQAYGFTSPGIASALKRAHDRGIDVKVILDKSQKTERYSGLTYLVHAGIPVWVDSEHSIAHNKIIIQDGVIVCTGSFNFTSAAEKHNAENLIILEDRELATIYLRNWQIHLTHSDKF